MLSISEVNHMELELKYGSMPFADWLGSDFTAALVEKDTQRARHKQYRHGLCINSTSIRSRKKCHNDIMESSVLPLVHPSL